MGKPKAKESRSDLRHVGRSAYAAKAATRKLESLTVPTLGEEIKAFDIEWSKILSENQKANLSLFEGPVGLYAIRYFSQKAIIKKYFFYGKPSCQCQGSNFDLPRTIYLDMEPVLSTPVREFSPSTKITNSHFREDQKVLHIFLRTILEGLKG